MRELLALGAAIDSDSPRLDAELLLGFCLDKSRTWLYTWPEATVAADVEAQFRALIARRIAGEPVAHLLGRREFWSLDLEVSAATLIPRPDTETLIETVLELPLPTTARVVDLGTGTGAIALALALERSHWQLTATDASAQALTVARRNVERLAPGRVRLLEGSWYQPLGAERFDLIVSNPPYIEALDPHLDCGDLRYEPRSALVAGPTGLDDLDWLIKGAPERLETGGFIVLEHGFDQGEAVRSRLTRRGFTAVHTRQDAAGQERVSCGQWVVG